MTIKAQTMHEHHDKKIRALRKAAKRVAKADDEHFREALDKYAEAYVEWWNTIPRDQYMRPIR